MLTEAMRNFLQSLMAAGGEIGSLLNPSAAAVDCEIRGYIQAFDDGIGPPGVRITTAGREALGDG